MRAMGFLVMLAAMSWTIEPVRAAVPAAAVPATNTGVSTRTGAVESLQLPGISLKVSNASLAQVAAGLNEALQTTSKFQATGAGSGFTLEARDKPFWEVYAALAGQQPLTLTANAGGMQLKAGGSLLRRYAIDGPALAFVNAVTYRRTIPLQTAKGDQPVRTQLSATVQVNVDPRVPVVRFQGFTLLKATDEAGNNLLRSGTNTADPSRTLENQMSLTLALATPENLGKTLALSCEVVIVAGVGENRVMIEDVQSKVNKPVLAGGRTFQVARFDTSNPGTVNLRISETTTPPPAPPATSVTRVTYSLLDSAGKAIWMNSGSGAVNVNISAGASTGPYKLEIRVPDKNVDVPVRFELKDIPLP